MMKSAIKLATLALFSVALIASPPSIPAFAAGGGGDPPSANPPPPPPDTRPAPRSSSKSKKKPSKQSSADDAAFRQKFQAAKQQAKQRFAYWVRAATGTPVDPGRLLQHAATHSLVHPQEVALAGQAVGLMVGQQSLPGVAPSAPAARSRGR